MSELAVGIDLGGTTTAVGLVDAEGRITAFDRFLTDSGKGPRDWVARVQAAVSQIGGGGMGTVTTVGIGSPGPLDLEAGSIIRAGTLDWEDVPLRSLLEEALGLPVMVENDAVAAAWGEVWVGAGRGFSDVVCITLGTGVGGGIILGGEIVRGVRGIGGHVGHVIVEVDGRPCTCGSRGCLESYASATAIRERFRERVAGGEASSLQDDLNARTIFKAAVSGDSLAISIYEETACYLAAAITSVANLIDPELFVISGAVAGAGDVLLVPLRREIEALNFFGLEPSPRFAVGELGVQAGVIGSAGLAIKAKG